MDAVVPFFLNRYILALVVPFLLLIAGAYAKKLVTKEPLGWNHFYLGVEFTLAAMSATLVQIGDFAQKIAEPGAKDKLIVAVCFLVVTFFLLLVVMSTHQDWQSSKDRNGQVKRLGLLSNVIGGGLMCTFTLIVKGV